MVSKDCSSVWLSAGEIVSVQHNDTFLQNDSSSLNKPLLDFPSINGYSARDCSFC